jgi:hypothetical protein
LLRLLLLSSLIASLGCSTLIVDTSPSAAFTGDLTLLHSCNRTLGSGVDVCRFTEGSPINSTWDFILPVDENSIDEVVIRLRLKDKVQVKTTKSNKISVDLAEFLGHTAWQKQDDGPVQAVVQVKYTVNKETRYIDLLGYAYFIVLRPGYTPLDIREEVEWSYICTVKYSTSGRSVVQCQP